MAALHQYGIKRQQATCGSASAWSEASWGLDALCSLMRADSGALWLHACRYKAASDSVQGVQHEPARTCRLRNRSYTCSSVITSVATSGPSRMSHSLKIAVSPPKLPRLICAGNGGIGVNHCRDPCSSEPSAEQDRSLEGPGDKLQAFHSWPGQRSGQRRCKLSQLRA